MALLHPAAAGADPALGRPQDFPPSERAISVSPAVLPLTVSAGSTVRVYFVVRNETLVAYPFNVSSEDLEPGTAAEGGVRFVPSGTAELGAAAWVHPARPHFRLASGAQEELGVDIRVPAGAAAGGHYAALVVEAAPPTPGSLALKAQVSPLLLLTVRGHIRHRIEARLVPEHRLRSGAPVRWTVVLRNRGNVHEELTGRVVVRSLFGPRVAAPLRTMVLLPGVTRRERVGFDVRSVPDLLRARLELRRPPGVDEPGRLPAARAASVLLLPWWLAVVAALLVLLAWWRTRRRRAQRREAGPGDAWPADGVRPD